MKKCRIRKKTQDLVLCELMARVLERSENAKAGIVRGFDFSNGGRAIIVHVTRAEGRGKERKEKINAILNFCPFCGSPITSDGESIDKRRVEALLAIAKRGQNG
jgi:hypothetical protein